MSVTLNYSDLEDAFFYISMNPQFANSAFLNTKTGEFYYVSDYGDSDELPEDIDESEDYIAIPHKNDLDLGQKLVEDFVLEHCEGEIGKVMSFFRHKGAYSKYKYFLERKGLLDEWHQYEDDITKKALLEWCSENNINVSL